MMASCNSCKQPGDTCYPVGRLACGQHGQLLVCGEDGLWEPDRGPTGIGTDTCNEGDYCIDDGHQYATCVDDNCDVEHEDFCLVLLYSTSCDGFVVQECRNLEGMNCPFWTDIEDCAASGMVCSIEGGSAACVPPGPCTNGATRCTADNSQVETCSDNQWTVTATCATGQACSVVGETAQCVATEDDCTTDLDALRCNPDDDVWIQECRNVGTMETPKMEWRDYIDCSEGSADEICIEDPSTGTSPMCGLPFT